MIDWNWRTVYVPCQAVGPNPHPSSSWCHLGKVWGQARSCVGEEEFFRDGADATVIDTGATDAATFT